MYGGGGFDAGGFGGGFDAGGQFGGGDQFGGGGFGGAAQSFSQQNAGGGFQVDNSTPPAPGKTRDKQSLIPTTIKQLKNAPGASTGEASFTIDGHDLHQVTIVGLITQADEQSTNLQYQLDDGTGNIMVKMWIDADADEAFNERRAQWKEGVVVRVIGQLRSFNNSRSLVAYSIQPITNFNEYTFHFIDVVHTHLKHTKGKPAAAAPSMMMGGGAPMGGIAMPPAQAGYGAPPAAGADVNDLVLSFFKTKGENSDTGCTIQEVCAAVAAQNISEPRVREAVEFLSNEGHLYSTIDDEHFKATA
mmetsp:Transcript_15159/g.39944  ORF Transcript_15159/g.39944 Transcript_15159/m.39944 type:complete len:303 (+) Transcript_15159:42-950(+)